MPPAFVTTQASKSWRLIKTWHLLDPAFITALSSSHLHLLMSFVPGLCYFYSSC